MAVIGRPQEKRSSVSVLQGSAWSGRLFNLGEMSCFNQHNAVQWI